MDNKIPPKDWADQHREIREAVSSLVGQSLVTEARSREQRALDCFPAPPEWLNPPCEFADILNAHAVYIATGNVPGAQADVLRNFYRTMSDAVIAPHSGKGIALVVREAEDQDFLIRPGAFVRYTVEAKIVWRVPSFALWP